MFCSICGVAFWNMPREQHGFCRTPSDVGMDDMVGTWTARYEHHWVRSEVLSETIFMTGTETIILSPDGSYSHIFENENVHYVSEPARWSLDMSAVDAPKLKMEDMRFFAAGETVDEVNANLSLSPEKADLLEFQGKFKESDRVDYPFDGFVYMYVRRCSRELVLQQMMFYHFWDPDSMGIDSPMFHNERHKALFGCLIPIDWCLDL